MFIVMKKIFLSVCLLFFETAILFAQSSPTNFELPTIDQFTLIGNDVTGTMESVIPEPPPEPVRTMAEWEELEAIVIAWSGGPMITNGILREIVRYAKEEVNVVIVCQSALGKLQVQNSLTNVGIDWTTNVSFVVEQSNSVWIRDYGPNAVYANDVEQQYFIDWIYNRPRPLDDMIPDVVSLELDVPVYATTAEPLDLVHTGGNFLADGMGTAFSSKLILKENGIGNPFQASTKTEGGIDSIMQEFMGIELGRYIKMEELEFDSISHIDMHIKLLDEETLMVGEYPEGVADGPQIEANLQFVLDNYNTPFGNKYDVVRIPMPPDYGGLYPDNGGNYRTYTNSIIVNNTILVPFYEEEYDTTAQRIWEEVMPGYKVQGINCNNIIGSLGAIHCITKEVGVKEPLLINHAKIREGCAGEKQDVHAIIQHKSGIASVDLFYSTDTTAGYEETPMILDVAANNYWGEIPPQLEGTEVFYYIHATANNGKEISRPLPAPKAYYHYAVKPASQCIVGNENVLLDELKLEAIYPNPARSITVVPVTSDKAVDATIEISDVLGRTIKTIFDGKLPLGKSNYYIHANEFAAGTYFVSLTTEEQSFVEQLVIR